MKFSEAKAANGIPIVEYANTLVERAREAGYIICIIAHNEDIPDTHVLANITNIPDMLRGVIRIMDQETNAGELLPPEEQLNLTFPEPTPQD